MNMLWNAKNGCVNIGNTDMDYVSFGHGSKVLVFTAGTIRWTGYCKGKGIITGEAVQDVL